MYFSRRDFLKKAGATAIAATTLTDLLADSAAKKLWFDISLAEWSLHK